MTKNISFHFCLLAMIPSNYIQDQLYRTHNFPSYLLSVHSKQPVPRCKGKRVGFASHFLSPCLVHIIVFRLHKSSQLSIALNLIKHMLKSL